MQRRPARRRHAIVNAPTPGRPVPLGASVDREDAGRPPPPRGGRSRSCRCLSAARPRRQRRRRCRRRAPRSANPTTTARSPSGGAQTVPRTDSPPTRAQRSGGSSGLRWRSERVGATCWCRRARLRGPLSPGLEPATLLVAMRTTSSASESRDPARCGGSRPRRRFPPHARMPADQRRSGRFTHQRRAKCRTAAGWYVVCVARDASLATRRHSDVVSNEVELGA